MNKDKFCYTFLYIYVTWNQLYPISVQFINILTNNYNKNLTNFFRYIFLPNAAFPGMPGVDMCKGLARVDPEPAVLGGKFESYCY